MGWVVRWLLGPSHSSRGRSAVNRYPGRPSPVRVVSVQDGDSITVRAPQSKSEDRFRVRLYAIDAPEHDQQYGDEARDYLRRLVWNRNDLILEPIDTDRHGRLVGVLYYREAGRQRSVNRLMVQQGLAWWYSRYGGHGLGLEQGERDARGRRRGMWASRGQVAPWEHRRAQRQRAKGTGCLKWVMLAAVIGAAVVAVSLWNNFV